MRRAFLTAAAVVAALAVANPGFGKPGGGGGGGGHGGGGHGGGGHSSRSFSGGGGGGSVRSFSGGGGAHSSRSFSSGGGSSSRSFSSGAAQIRSFSGGGSGKSSARAFSQAKSSSGLSGGSPATGSSRAKDFARSSQSIQSKVGDFKPKSNSAFQSNAGDLKLKSNDVVRSRAFNNPGTADLDRRSSARSFNLGDNVDRGDSGDRLQIVDRGSNADGVNFGRKSNLGQGKGDRTFGDGEGKGDSKKFDSDRFDQDTWAKNDAKGRGKPDWNRSNAFKSGGDGNSNQTDRKRERDLAVGSRDIDDRWSKDKDWDGNKGSHKDWNNKKDWDGKRGDHRDWDRKDWKGKDWDRDGDWNRNIDHWAWRKNSWNRPWYAHYHPWHNHWHRGYWNYWGGGWYPWAWFGTRAWIGWWAWPSYYYVNPYCDAPTVTTVYYPDYSQPIPQPPEQPQPDVQQQAMALFDAARNAFRARDYADALAKTDQAIQLLPSDAALHEFRALDLFALGQYKEAASGVYAVLAAGPGWDWETVSQLYGNVDDYTEQLRALEQFQKQQLDLPEARFLLAYHYLVTGYPQQATKQLQRVAELQPDDKLAAGLLKAIQERGKPPEPAGVEE